MKKKRTIYHIASELGLSPGTISKIINNTGKVSDETRKRVLEHIKAVGYVPAISARNLKSKNTKTIGVVFTEELDIGLEHSFFSSILQHFKSFVENEGYELSFIVSKLGQNRLSYLDWCRNKRVDGVFIVVGNYNDQGIYELIQSEIPCISTDMILDGLHTVVSDNELAVKMVLNYIKQSLNKKHVAMIVGPQQSKAFQERYVAFQQYAESLGLTYSNQDIAFSQGFGFTSGFNATMELFDANKSTAEVVFVSSDDIALGVLKALKTLGKRVPEDVQVIGFDDLPVSRFVTPALTTVAQNRKALGEEAAKILIRLIERPDMKQPEIVKIPVTLTIRESTLEKTTGPSK